jgi:hypothetical protein
VKKKPVILKSHKSPQEFGPWMKTSQLSVYDPNYE